MDKKLGALNLRKCTSLDVDEIMSLQDEVFTQLAGKNELLRKNERTTFVDCVHDPNITIGIYDKDELIGIAITAIVAGTADDLAPSIKSVKIENSAYTKLIMIKRRYYGLGIQKAMMHIMEKLAYEAGYEYLLATVSPENKFSKDNLLSYGYVFDHEAIKYGGLKRDILYKKISAPFYYDALLNKASSLSEKGFGDIFADLDIDILNCFNGTKELLTAGDILVYRGKDSDDTVYGLYLGQNNKKELLYFTEENKYLLSDINKDTSLEICKILINPQPVKA